MRIKLAEELPMASSVTSESSVVEVVGKASDQRPPSPPPEIAGRDDFRIDQRVSFIDQHLQRRVGLIVRIKQRTATRDCEGQSRRVAFGLLRHLVDV